MLKNLNILLVCKESYSCPMYYLALDLMKNNNVAAFFVLPTETKTKRCIYNKDTYYKFIDKGIKTFTCNDISDEFTKNLKNPPVNDEIIEYLKQYEKNRRINIQLLSSQAFCTEYHNRICFKASNYKQQLYWCYLNICNAEKICNDFQPDVVLDLDVEEFGRITLHAVCAKRNIPYISIGYSRYLEYKYYHYGESVEGNEYLFEAYKDNFHLSNEDLYEEMKYVNEFRKSSSILSAEYNNTPTSKYHADPLWKTFIYLLKSAIIAFDMDYFRGGKAKLHRKNDILYISSVKLFWWTIDIEKKKRYLYKNNKYFEPPVKGEKYYYMPLHLIPESSSLGGAPYYINELAVIEAVSKSLPLGYYLYVKEHQSMLGERNFRFYEQVKKLPNVRLMQINYYEDPKPWIVNSEGVITLTGTSGYEAVMLGKPAFIFGDVVYSMINGVTRVKSFEDLPELFATKIDYELNIKSCAAYIKTIKEMGEPINITILLNEANHSLVANIEPSNAFFDCLKHLEKFYDEAYELVR
ncbi:MAG: hypothetical protein K5871_04865 [Lachnospiraceae bacterium]|nr:hypothetical protein [Lachnospiraceae bacterium]